MFDCLRALSFRKKKRKFRWEQKWNFRLVKNLFHLVVNPVRRGARRFYSVNMNLWINICFYLLLVTYQLIQGQGTRGAKVPPLWGQQKNIPCIDAWARGKPFWFADWAMTDFFIAVDLKLVQTTRNVKLNGTRNSVRKFQPGKRAHLFRFSTFSGNFPVGRTDETCSIYRRTNQKFRKFWLNEKRPKCSISERSTVFVEFTGPRYSHGT